MSSLCYTVGPCCYSVLYIVVCICQSQLLSYAFSSSPLVSQVCFLYICDYFCFVNKFICTIFLDSTCKPYHMIFVFLSLTYFTWYDNLQVHPSCCKWHYFFFAVEYCSIVYMYHIFLILYPVDGGSDGKESTCNAGAAAVAAKLLQSCPTLCDPIDGSPPGSPVPGILQARTLEWVAISFSNV